MWGEMRGAAVRIPIIKVLIYKMWGEMADEKKPERKKHPEKALSAGKIKNAKPGRYADGNGLYLVVDDSGAKRWMLRTVIRGKRCDLGLGGLSLVSLADARGSSKAPKDSTQGRRPAGRTEGGTACCPNLRSHRH